MKLYSHIKKGRIKNKILEYLSSLKTSYTGIYYYDCSANNILGIHHNIHRIFVNYPFIPGDISNNRELLHEVIKSHYNLGGYSLGITIEYLKEI